jgi:putative inorganic carbon (hco3(-)) transporter
MLASGDGTEDGGLVAVNVHDADAALLEKTGETPRSVKDLQIAAGQKDEVGLRRACLGGELAIVKERERGRDASRRKPSQQPEDVALDAPEELADRADGDAPALIRPLRGRIIAFVNGYGHQASGIAPAAPASAMATLGRNLYLVFVASWFLHLPARLPALGTIRFDLILVVLLTLIAFAGASKQERLPATPIDKMLRVLILYVLVTTPFVEWPGSVLRAGMAEFVKAVVFYYFTVAFIRSGSDLKIFITVFLACQIFRVVEPLYLHVTQGYWGSTASMANWEFLDRLSGSPYDPVNPNGLAVITCTVLLFLYYMAGVNRLNFLVFLAVAPACLYVLALTGSRSGLVALFAIVLVIFVKSRHRILVATASVLIFAVGFSLLNADQQDRYLSLFGMGEKNLVTAEQRIGGLEIDFEVALRRPIVGHGLGTSREANANFGGKDQVSHNLYLEVFQELGLLGLIIFLVFLGSIVKACTELRRAYARAGGAKFRLHLVDALQVWLWMNLLFSLASYGLSDYEWYLLGGLAVAMLRMTTAPATATHPPRM